MPPPASNVRIEFRKYTGPEVLPSISQLTISGLWHRDWSEELGNKILQWRFCELEGGEIMLAYDGDRRASSQDRDFEAADDRNGELSGLENPDGARWAAAGGDGRATY